MIPSQDRLIVALDLPTPRAARKLVEQLGESITFYKLGLELFMAGGYFELIDWLLKRNKKIFVDLKFFDVPATVNRAVQQLNNRGISFATVHGNDSIVQAAVDARVDVKLLAVTVLTSLDRGDLKDLGFDCDVEELVLSRARRAAQIGCDGVIASGLEAGLLRQELGNKLLIVSPGIRPIDNDDDQKRVVTPTQAFQNGADYIVVGRPVRDATNPKQVAEKIQQEIEAIFSTKNASQNTWGQI